MLKDTITTLQADLLPLKQRTFACEKIRTDEMRMLHDMLSCLKSEIKTQCDSVKQSLCSSIETVSVSKQPNTEYMNSKLEDLDARIQVFENIVDAAEVMAVNINALCRVNQEHTADPSHESLSEPPLTGMHPHTEHNDDGNITPIQPIKESVPLNSKCSSSSLSATDIDALENFFLHRNDEAPVENLYTQHGGVENTFT